MFPFLHSHTRSEETLEKASEHGMKGQERLGGELIQVRKLFWQYACELVIHKGAL